MNPKKFKLDALDKKIIIELQHNGRIPYKDIAKKLKVSDGTIRLRTEKMIKSNFLRITASIDPFYFENSITALIGINIAKRSPAELMQKISNMSGVKSVCNATGRYDLFVEVFFDSREALKNFLASDLSQMDAITFTETFVYLDALNKWVAFQ
jgi:Lrp/AsnC family transcriptional regulator for asnA, asnC and gidA